MAKSKNSMSDAAREARNAYYRDWHKKHPEASRKAQARYWERKAAAIAAAESDRVGGGNA